MTLATLADILPAARAGRYAVPAFNVDNLEIIDPLVRAAESERAPVIIQSGPVGLDHAGWELVAVVVRERGARSPVPVVLHLDHGASLAQVERALSLGFTSVMVDGSALGRGDNEALTREAVAFARRAGASVEAELGSIPGQEEGIDISDEAAQRTDPRTAQEFVAATGVDALAIAAGNVHWVPDAPVRLDVKRIRAIAAEVAVPLVLHGGSGLDRNDTCSAISAGVSKLNIAFGINRPFLDALSNAVGHGNVESAPGRKRAHPHKVLLAAREAARRAAQDWIRLFGASGRAA